MIMEIQSYTFRVPTLFYKDHQYRSDTPAGEVLQSGKLISVVKFTKEQLDDLWSDADYYASFKGTEDYEENASVVDSAITTLKRLQRYMGNKHGN